MVGLVLWLTVLLQVTFAVAQNVNDQDSPSDEMWKEFQKNVRVSDEIAANKIQTSKKNNNMVLDATKRYLNLRNNMVLDATKRYLYLRNVENIWKNDEPNVNQKKLINRWNRLFDTLDMNGDGILKMHEVLVWPNRWELLVGASKKEMETLISAFKTFFRAVGVTKEGLKREDWVKEVQRFAKAEKSEGKSLTSFVTAIFGRSTVMDMRELKFMMKAFEVPENAAYPFFEKADTDHSGGLSIKEMSDLLSKFWLEDYNSAYDDIFGRKY